MKKTIIGITALFCLWAVIANAQPGGPPPHMSPEKREKVEAMKVAFYTQKLELTADEAKVFWPVFNQYQDEMMKLREGKFKEMKEAKAEAEDLTEKDYEKIYDSEISFRQAELDLMKKYHPQLKKTLPMKKLAKLHRIENEFKKELLNMIRDRKDDKGGPDNRPRRR